MLMGVLVFFYFEKLQAKLIMFPSADFMLN